MPDIFLSYSREDASTARRFAEALHRLRAAPGPRNYLRATADHYGDKDLVLMTIRKQIAERNAPQIFARWEFNESRWRSDPRYKDILRDLGLLDYYRTSGQWPDFCSPVGADDFECH